MYLGPEALATGLCLSSLLYKTRISTMPNILSKRRSLNRDSAINSVIINFIYFAELYYYNYYSNKASSIYEDQESRLRTCYFLFWISFLGKVFGIPTSIQNSD